MTQSPPVPRSRRNLTDLDALIDASIGKSETYTALPQLGLENGTVGPDTAPSTEKPSMPRDFNQATAPATMLPDARVPTEESKAERFRISIDASVIMATKMRAVQQKVSPSEVVEKALKQYLNLSTRE